jgi:hypothetical protein
LKARLTDPQWKNPEGCSQSIHGATCDTNAEVDLAAEGLIQKPRSQESFRGTVSCSIIPFFWLSGF